MRSAHIFYRSMTLLADTYVGTDGVLILRPHNEFQEHAVVFGTAVLLVLLAAFNAAC
jgi:hypothetical protein